MIAEVTTVGHDDLIRLMVMAGAEATPLMARMLREAAENIMRESQEEVPLRFGPLKASGRVSGPFREGDNIMVSLSYGNTAVQYAMYQHEGQRADGSHQVRNYGTSSRGGKSGGNGKKKQYLSDPVEAAIPSMAPIMAMKIQEILGHV